MQVPKLDLVQRACGPSSNFPGIRFILDHRRRVAVASAKSTSTFTCTCTRKGLLLLNSLSQIEVHTLIKQAKDRKRGVLISQVHL